MSRRLLYSLIPLPFQANWLPRPLHVPFVTRAQYWGESDTAKPAADKSRRFSHWNTFLANHTALPCINTCQNGGEVCWMQALHMWCQHGVEVCWVQALYMCTHAGTEKTTRNHVDCRINSSTTTTIGIWNYWRTSLQLCMCKVCRVPVTERLSAVCRSFTPRKQMRTGAWCMLPCLLVDI